MAYPYLYIPPYSTPKSSCLPLALTIYSSSCKLLFTGAMYRHAIIKEGKTMVWLNSCPRCDRGDVILDNDQYGWLIRCVQCGYSKDIDNPHGADAALRQLTTQREVVAEMAQDPSARCTSKL